MDGISIGKSATAKKYDFNVTSAVRLWKKGKYNPEYGLMFQNGVETNSSYRKHVYMREKSGYQPFLSITYNTHPNSKTVAVETDTYYFVQNCDSDYYFDIKNSGVDDGTPLIQYHLKANNNQRIRINYISNGEYEISPAHVSGKVITANSNGNVYIKTKNNECAQRWYIIKSGSSFYIINKLFNERLTINNNTKEGSSVILSNTQGYLWRLRKANIYISSNSYKAGVRAKWSVDNYYYDYTLPMNNLFIDAVTQCKKHRCMNWEQYCSWCSNYHLTPDSSQFLGMQTGSFSWFYTQVNHGCVWDIKREEIWNNALPNVPYLGITEKFFFRNELISAEDAGNIMYGYAGRATGFGDVTLYWGGGVAAKHSLNNDEVNSPPTYGDDQNDHEKIEYGYNLFNCDYPNYPEVGYQGIPVESGILAAIADLLLNPST